MSRIVRLNFCKKLLINRIGDYARFFLIFDAVLRLEAVIKQNFFEEAINWSSNKFERMIVNIYIESTQKVRQKHDIKDDMGIDEIIMQLVGCHWQKVAMIAGTVMALRSGLVDTNIAERVKVLVSSGLLELQGSLSNMRYSEVRLPVGKEGAVTDTLS
ncbi:DUF3658 domain-containing protein [Methylobacterium sp. Leaf108]|uniref:DUF3658 domain-containing protein n=1 Tax=Methylobacterium sp. Leaf108 TaxID=1736256 RepID=UPI0012E8E241|nr:DUF3658 domain-containing protein [Methylobacterium sp. Leaf108]